MIKRPVIRYLNTPLRTSYKTSRSLRLFLFYELEQVVVTFSERRGNGK